MERYDSMPIWVKLPNVPFEYWSLDFFKLIGNTLGTFFGGRCVFPGFGGLLLGEGVSFT